MYFNKYSELTYWGYVCTFMVTYITICLSQCLTYLHSLSLRVSVL